MEKVQGVEAGVAYAITHVGSQSLLCFSKNKGVENNGKIMFLPLNLYFDGGSLQ